MPGPVQERAQAEEGQVATLSPPLLAVRALRKRYGATVALAGVDLTVEAGELVGLLGPNGAGKSTLAGAVCGLVRPDDGETLIDGVSSRAPRARRRLGYLAELFRFPDWLTPSDLLRLHQDLAGSRGGRAERNELLAAVELDHVGHRRIATLSKGMQQRLGLAQALVGRPRLVLLDEPTSALDPVGRLLVRELLAKLRSDGVGVLLNSHLLTEVEATCSRIVVLRDGQIVHEGATEDLPGARGVTIHTRSGPRSFAGASRDDVPGLIRDLIGQGEDVYDVTVEAPTLEDVYLDAMRTRPPP